MSEGADRGMGYVEAVGDRWAKVMQEAMGQSVHIGTDGASAFGGTFGQRSSKAWRRPVAASLPQVIESP